MAAAAPEGAAGAPPRRRRAGLALSIALPATVAAIAVLAAPGSSSAPKAPRGSADALARTADRGAGAAATVHDLRPLIAVSSRELMPAAEIAGAGTGTRPGVPARISIPALDVEAPMQPVRARASELAVPRVGRAGWYRDGPRPGEPGHAVVIGHLDSRTGPGLFARVPALRKGALVAVHDRLGDVHRYRVVGGATVPKTRFPAAAVYGPSSRPVLVLVTCGGPYKRGRGYRDNVLVYARAA